MAGESFSPTVGRFWHFFTLILCCSWSLSSGMIDNQECLNTSRIDHLQCLIDEQVTNIKELLQVLQESKQVIDEIKHEMNINFKDQETALNDCLKKNTSLVNIPIGSNQTCSASSAVVWYGPSADSEVMAHTTDMIRSCRDLQVTTQALLQPLDELYPFWVLCVQNHKEIGGWLVIQVRVSFRESFFRSWIEYREGFGILSGDFWLGLESIHRLTKPHHHELLVELADEKSNYKFARYSRFEIASEDDGYALRNLGSYSGTAGDSLRPHVGLKFSTYDNDRDRNEGRNCALEFNSGWWFDNCWVKGSNLNGVHDGPVPYKINWYRFFNDYKLLKYSRMMIRPIK